MDNLLIKNKNKKQDVMLPGEVEPSGEVWPSGEFEPSGEVGLSGELQPSGEVDLSGEVGPSGEGGPSGKLGASGSSEGFTSLNMAAGKGLTPESGVNYSPISAWRDTCPEHVGGDSAVHRETPTGVSEMPVTKASGVITRSRTKSVTPVEYFSFFEKPSTTEGGESDSDTLTNVSEISAISSSVSARFRKSGKRTADERDSLSDTQAQSASKTRTGKRSKAKQTNLDSPIPPPGEH